MNRKLTVNADDFGAASSINKAITDCFDKSIINQTTIMVNMSCYNEAVGMAEENDFKDKVGIHLNLSLGTPLTERIRMNKRLCNPDGEFNSSFFSSPLHTFYISKDDKRCLSEEIDAQFEKYKQSGFTLMHFDSHEHIHERISVLKVIIPLAKKHGFKSCRLSKNTYSVKEKSQKSNYIKLLYKFFVNRLIKKHFNTSAYFGSYESYFENKSHLKASDVEVMVHPIYKNGKLLDIIDDGVYKDITLYKF